MKFLLSIGSAEMSKDTILFGGRIAAAFSADLSVLYVGPSQPGAHMANVEITRSKLTEWEIDLPGVKVLEYAEELLKEIEILETTDQGDIVEKHALKPDVQGAFELHAVGTHGENVRLRLREGDIVDQIKAEVEIGEYDLAIMGASKERRLIHRIVQFVDCSLFITKNIRDIDYKFLFCVDDTELSRKAVFLGARAAAYYRAEATLLGVAKKRKDTPLAESHLKRAARLLDKFKIPHDTKIRVGDPLKIILEEAGDDHIVAMGSSRSSEVSKLFRGTKAIKVVQEGNSPVLIAK